MPFSVTEPFVSPLRILPEVPCLMTALVPDTVHSISLVTSLSSPLSITAVMVGSCVSSPVTAPSLSSGPSSTSTFSFTVTVTLTLFVRIADALVTASLALILPVSTTVPALPATILPSLIIAVSSFADVHSSSEPISSFVPSSLVPFTFGRDAVSPVYSVTSEESVLRSLSVGYTVSLSSRLTPLYSALMTALPADFAAIAACVSPAVTVAASLLPDVQTAVFEILSVELIASRTSAFTPSDSPMNRL
ncbi:hypothetical protein D3C71_1385650 [compost metagenome]